VRGCLLILLLGAIVLGFGVYVGLPAAASAIVTAGVTAAGLQAGDTTVTVGSRPPTELLGLHADRVRIEAKHATFRGLKIGSLDVELADVAILDRTAGSVDGRLEAVTVPDLGGRPLTLAEITLSGGGKHVSASTTVGGAEAEALLADAIESALGVRPSSVALSAPNRLTVRLGQTVHARLVVSAAGDLEAEILDGPEAGRTVVLLRSGGNLPIHLTSVRVTGAGDLRLTGDVAVPPLGSGPGATG
jgi:hypothetical protein